jgi:acetyl-CoA carboxylase biotin carboxyl carrier protein
MSDRDEDLRQIERAAAELIPALAERLSSNGLGEIEVEVDDLHVRVAGAPAAPLPAAAALAVPLTPDVTARPSAGTTAGPHAVPSPAVGYFMYGDGLGPGLEVEKGDALGFVEVLGVRHDVRAPRRGVVRNLVTETGEAVEYGQTLLELEGAEA